MSRDTVCAPRGCVPGRLQRHARALYVVLYMHEKVRPTIDKRLSHVHSIFTTKSAQFDLLEELAEFGIAKKLCRTRYVVSLGQNLKQTVECLQFMLVDADAYHVERAGEPGAVGMTGYFRIR